jgi:hypothetical protein
VVSRETAAKIGGSPRRRRRYRDTWTTARPVVGRLVSVYLGSTAPMPLAVLERTKCFCNLTESLLLHDLGNDQLFDADPGQGFEAV